MAKILRCYNCGKEVATVEKGTGGKGCAIFCSHCIELLKPVLNSLNKEVKEGCEVVDNLMNLFNMKK
jgi:hypothetical protein